MTTKTTTRRGITISVKQVIIDANRAKLAAVIESKRPPVLMTREGQVVANLPEPDRWNWRESVR